MNFGRLKNLVLTGLLVLAALAARFYGLIPGVQQGGGASDVQMTQYNASLPSDRRDDAYRTTYEIFVYSFCDSDGDGIGDLDGIRSKLDYIQELGFDEIWLTPVHPSDTYHKYDVKDYYGIDPQFGTLQDYEELLDECHRRGIRVLMDLVINHTSSAHPWFREAADYYRTLSPGDTPDTSVCRYADYYHFSPAPKDGYAQLNGTGWYYEARFWSEMPDLDLDSPAVRQEIADIASYWIDKGVDGFRLDAVTSYYTADTDRNRDFLRYFCSLCKGIDPDCYIVGEAWTDRGTIASLYSSGIDSLFDFPYADSGGIIRSVMSSSMSAHDFVRAMIATENTFRAANGNYIDAPFYTNHDTARSAGYYAMDDGPVTKMAYGMSLLMSGNSFLYYGEEIGMKGSGKDENKRAPMYWSDDPDDPDMCDGPPYMDTVEMKFPSAEEQMQDEHSLWTWFREVIRVRNAFPVIARGTTAAVDDVCTDAVAAFIRYDEVNEPVLIVMNVRGNEADADLSVLNEELRLAAVLNTSEEGISYENAHLHLPPYSIAVLTESD